MLNSVNVVGRITKDPVAKMINGDTAVVNFGIAVNRPYKNKETNEYEADFFNCAAFKQTAEFMGSYVKKGDLIAVVGALTTRTYEKEGQTHYVVEIRANQVLSYATKGSTESVLGKFQTVEEVQAAWKKEYDSKSLGLDENAKSALKAQLHKKYQPEIDRISDLPF